MQYALCDDMYNGSFVLLAHKKITVVCALDKAQQTIYYKFTTQLYTINNHFLSMDCKWDKWTIRRKKIDKRGCLVTILTYE